MHGKRIEYNKKIIKVISEWVEAHPDERFIQALWNLNLINWMSETSPDLLIEDRYHEEPWETLKKMKGVEE